MVDMENKDIRTQWWSLYKPNTGIRHRIETILESYGIHESMVVDQILHDIYETPTAPFATKKAHEFIRMLVTNGHTVTIWTQGDPVYQYAKIDHFGFHELYDQLQFIVSTDKCEALAVAANSFDDKRFILADDRAHFLKRSAQMLSQLPYQPATTTIHVSEDQKAIDAWKADVQVSGVDVLLKQHRQVFEQPAHVLCDFDRTLFDPDAFTAQVIIPRLEEAVKSKSD